MEQTVRRRMRGRPRKLDSPAAEPPGVVRRSLRPRNLKCVLDLDDYFDDDDELFEDDFEDHNRKKKKLHHLLKYGATDEPKPKHRRARHVDLGYESPEISDEDRRPSKKGKVYESEEEDVYRAESTCNEDEEDEVRDTKPDRRETENCSQQGTPLPDRKTLELIMDKLQKKDIYGVYAEPADPEELPDYYDRIKNPMDFATVRKKLSNGAYATLEQFESDIFLICSNAMRYNEPGTIYHKQARSIRELAKKKFDEIRLNAESMEKEIVPEKMSSSFITKKQITEPVSRVLHETIGSDLSSGVTRSMPIDAPIHDESRQSGATHSMPIDACIHDENCRSTHTISLSTPIDAPIYDENCRSTHNISLSTPTGVHDEDRRSTYSTSLAFHGPSTESLFSTSEEESKHLIPVGLYSDHSYARSLSRFAATLGTVAWKVAANRIEQALPTEVKFGRGWVEEYEPLPTPILRLKNCFVKEPDFFSKVQPPVDPWRTQDTPFVPHPSVESLEKNPQFVVSGIRPPMAPFTADSLPTKEHLNRLNHSEQKLSFPLSCGTKSCGSTNLNYPHQTLQSRTAVKSDQMFSEQVELNGPPNSDKDVAESFQHGNSSRGPVTEASRVMEFNSGNTRFTTSRSFKQLGSNGIGGGLADGKYANAESLEHTQISKGPDMESSRLMDFNSGNTSFLLSRSFKHLDSNGNAGGLADAKFVNAQSLEHRQNSKGPGMEASRLMDFNSGNTSLPLSRSFKHHDSNGSAGGLADGKFVNAQSLELGQISKGPDMEVSRLMDFNSGNTSFPLSRSFKHLDSNGSAEGLADGRFVNAQSLGLGQISKGPDMGASRLDFNSRNTSFPPSRSFKQFDSNEISGGLADGKFVNAQSLEHRQISKGPDTASRLMDFNSGNTSFPPSRSFKELDGNGITGRLTGGRFVNAESLEHRQISKGPDRETSRLMDFNSGNTSYPPSRSFNQHDSNGIAGGLAGGRFDHAGSFEHRQIPKGPDIEAARSVDFNSKLTSFPPSRSFNQFNSNGIIAGLSDGKFVTPVACVPSNMANPSSSNFRQGQQGLSDPVQLMRMLAEKSQHQYPNESSSATPQVFLSEQSLSSMSEARGPFPMRVVNSQNHQIVYPQVTSAQLSRSQPWWNLGPQTLPVQKPKPFQPDLNVDFQSSGSPGRPPSGVSMDSQQPDLALQL